MELTFDFIGVDHYWAEKIKDKYIDMVNPYLLMVNQLSIQGSALAQLPLLPMAWLSTLGNVDGLSVLLHQQPVIGRFIRPKLKVINERSEALQAKRLIDNLKLVDKAGFSGAFIDMFIFPLKPYSDTPKYDHRQRKLEPSEIL